MSKNIKKIFVDITIDKLDKTNGNLPEMEENFLDMALGMFIHWSIDVTIGSLASHWMIASHEEMLDKLYKDLPDLFFPTRFNTDEWALLAKTAGMKYVVFTTKHHGGFCMYDTKTTPFNVMNTRFGKDVLSDVMASFRKFDIETGIYFSPLDFTWCKENNKHLQFMTDEVIPSNNPGLLTYNEEQIREIFTNYGPISTVFFDGPPANLKDIVWEMSKNTIITRSEMPTPELELPDEIIDEPWEACYRLGNSWTYKASNEDYKSGTDIIKLLIDTRSKGGNMLLNVSPDTFGQIPIEQQRLLQELGLFIFFCGESIYKVRPYKVAFEENGIFYTKHKDEQTVYVFDTSGPWPYAKRKEITLQNVTISENTKITMLGQNGHTLEHHPETDTTTRFYQDKEGLHINAMRCFRPYSSRDWPNPVVFKITNIK